MYVWLTHPILQRGITTLQPPDGKPEKLQIFGLAERSYDDEISFVVCQALSSYDNFTQLKLS